MYFVCPQELHLLVAIAVHTHIASKSHVCVAFTRDRSLDGVCLIPPVWTRCMCRQSQLGMPCASSSFLGHPGPEGTSHDTSICLTCADACWSSIDACTWQSQQHALLVQWYMPSHLHLHPAVSSFTTAL
jgi:hypothetical protein